MVINMVKHMGQVQAIITLISSSGKAQHERICKEQIITQRKCWLGVGVGCNPSVGGTEDHCNFETVSGLHRFF